MATWTFVKRSGAPAGTIGVTTSLGTYTIDDSTHTTIVVSTQVEANELRVEPYLTLQGSTAATAPELPTVPVGIVGGVMMKFASPAGVPLDGSEQPHPPAKNLLLDNDAEFGTSVGAYTGTNATLSQNTANYITGTASLAMTATSANTLSSTLATTNVPNIKAGAAYSAFAQFKPATTARKVQVNILWYNSAKSLLSTSTGTQVTEVAGAWTSAYVTATAPANAVYAAIQTQVISAASAEIHYTDCYGIAAGISTAWQPGILNITFSGAPAFYAPQGTFYYRQDTPTVANQRIYVNTSTTVGTTWTALV